MKQNISKTFALLGTSASALCLMAAAASADQVFNDDVIIDGSLCVGMDCANGLSFGFDTVIIKENNTRLLFDDTSASASFPNNDWRLTANDSGNGGSNYFSIDDATANRQVFRVTAGAPANSLFVSSAGNVGLNNASPVVELSITDGDSPTMRLEQDGSNGWTAQTWDVAGNETNFFVRDVTGGSKLPFKIKPGANDNTLYLAADEKVGMGTAGPDAQLHIVQGGSAGLLVDGGADAGAAEAFAEFRSASATNAIPAMLIEDTQTSQSIRRLLELRNYGGVSIVMQNNASNIRWALVNQNSSTDSKFLINNADANGSDAELILDNSGNLTVLGTITSGATQLNVPDYVFEDGYELMELHEVASFIEENGHLPNVPSAGAIAEAGGLNMSQMQMTLLEKVEELTLYTLSQQEVIDGLQVQVASLVE
ncbi:MAG: hypothetical protein ACRBBS_18005 [Thalassovita sp.]